MNIRYIHWRSPVLIKRQIKKAQQNCHCIHIIFHRLLKSSNSFYFLNMFVYFLSWFGFYYTSNINFIYSFVHWIYRLPHCYMTPDKLHLKDVSFNNCVRKIPSLQKKSPKNICPNVKPRSQVGFSKTHEINAEGECCSRGQVL